jgi:hypothetical protein
MNRFSAVAHVAGLAGALSTARRLGALTLAARVGVLLVALTSTCSAASGADDPVIDPDVRAAVRIGTVRVLVDLRVSSGDPSAIGSLQDEALRRLAGTGAQVARRFSTTPLLALVIDASALARLEAMPDIVARVRADRIVPLDEDRSRR